MWKGERGAVSSVVAGCRSGVRVLEGGASWATQLFGEDVENFNLKNEKVGPAVQN